MTADIHTAAQAEAEATAKFGQPDFSAPNDRTIKWTAYVHGFTEGAVWAQARVTPTRDELVEALAEASDAHSLRVEELFYGDGTDPGTVHEFTADAILALLAGLAEGES